MSTAVDRTAPTRAQDGPDGPDRPGRSPRPVRAAGAGTGASSGATTRRGAGGRDGSGTPPTATPTPSRAARLPWILAIAGLVGTLGFGWAWRAERDSSTTATTATAQSGPSGEMRDAAEAFSKALTNFDGSTIDRDFDRIVARSTGQFRSQADQFFSTDVRKKLKEAQASSRGEVRSAFVQDSDGERGTVFVVLDQTIANNKSPQPKADTLRMELGLVLKDGTWRVERVSVLTAPTGSPGLGTTPGSDGSSGSSGGN
jgi:hypothetical protein